jgi:hypothetical protein
MRVVGPIHGARLYARERTTTAQQSRPRENFFTHLRSQVIANLRAA